LKERAWGSASEDFRKGKRGGNKIGGGIPVPFKAPPKWGAA